MLTNKLYDLLKYVAQFVLPAVATLYFGLAKIWNLPYPEQVIGTILAFDVFLGAILGITTAAYNKKMDPTGVYIQPVMPGVVNAEGLKDPLYYVMPKSTYDILYWVAQIVLPALGTLYFALASFWVLPYAEQVVGTIALIDAFLGIFLGVNTVQYKFANSIS
jgi:hypothetical protein